ncbi:MAG: putative transcriptional regulator [Caproiciproducens sp.]|nr:putative transcriptional regulator [Caproiciproducens sp.]
MYNIGQLARRCNVSRSTLLYYESIGLLTNSGRTPSNYRKYSETEAQRLEQICIYRKAGLPLDTIKKILNGTWNNATVLLEKRIHELNDEINTLREQQIVTVRLLLNCQVEESTGSIDRNGWVQLFKDAGFDDYEQWRWHRDFEATNPISHQLFLARVGFHSDDIDRVRTWAREEYQAIASTR